MPQVTYLLINTANMGHTTPMAVSGYSGKLYGHAEFDAKYGSHVFRVPAADYEGDMDLDIAKGMHRALQRWKIRVEVAPDEGSPEAALAEALEENAVMKKELEPYRKALAEASEEPLFEVPPFSSVGGPGVQPPPADGSCGDMIGHEQKLVPNPDGPKVHPSQAYLEMDPPELKAEIARLNEGGAGIEADLRSRVGMRKALADHYAKSQQAA